MTQATSPKVRSFLETFKARVTRQQAASLLACVHCGLCTEACHFALANPDDPSYAPAVKADRIRGLFKRHIDWTGRLLPRWVCGYTVSTDEDLDRLKDVVFGKCTNCRRCSFKCPMGVDFATFNRMARGVLVSVGVMPEGVRVVSRDQWEIGNQMGVLQEEYLETLDKADTLDDSDVEIPVDRENADIVFAINPREVKYDPRSIHDAAKIFHLAKERWTMSSRGWDMTNFGLFSGDDALGGTVARRVYESVVRLKAKKLVLSECGHGYRSTTCEGPNWSGTDIRFPIESFIHTMLCYLDEGRIEVDSARNPGSYTYHDSCNLARSCGMIEAPRTLLRRLVTDFREMTPNRTDNLCCTGGGGAMSMSEYTPERLRSARLKAEQLAATGADYVVTSCHNCVDGLTDVIKHYRLPIKVVQLTHLFANAARVEVRPPAGTKPLYESKILVIDDERDTLDYLEALLEDNGATVLTATSGEEGIRLAREERPDLLTLDLSMPGMDGADVFKALRRDETLKALKVCIVTGRPEMRHLIYERPYRRPEGYLNKPFTEDLLVQSLSQILGFSKERP